MQFSPTQTCLSNFKRLLSLNDQADSPPLSNLFSMQHNPQALANCSSS